MWRRSADTRPAAKGVPCLRLRTPGGSSSAVLGAAVGRSRTLAALAVRLPVAGAQGHPSDAPLAALGEWLAARASGADAGDAEVAEFVP